MAWTIEVSATALKQLKKLDRQWRAAIADYLQQRVAADPRRSGKALVGGKKGLWRYRVGDYRLICEIQDSRIVVLVLAVGHRGKVYR